MTGIIYVKTDRFEVKLEGIAFKAKDFESLYTLDFLFPKGKIWDRPPVVGIHVMRHPRDHNVALLLLCIGVGCVILRFRAGECLPSPIRKFLTDERIRFVGFGVPKKSDVFPYEELGLTREKVDIGYLAALRLNNPGYKRCQLKELARKVLGIKKMIGLTDASSFERHEHIKCAICQLFITSAVGMALLGSNDKKKMDDTPRIMSLLKNLNSLSMLTEGWLRLPKSRIKKDNSSWMLEKSKSEKLKNDVPFWWRLKDGKIKSDVPLVLRQKDDKTSPLGKRHKDEKIKSDVLMESDSADDLDMNLKTKEGNLANVIEDDINLKRRVKNGFSVDYIDMNFRKKEETTSTTDGFVLPKWMSSSQLLLNHASFDDLFDSPKEIKSARDVPLSAKLIENYSSDDSNKDPHGPLKKPLKGILKCPSSSKLDRIQDISPPSIKEPITPTSTFGRSNSKELTTSSSYKEPTTPISLHGRANSKGLTPSSSFKESTTPISPLGRSNSKDLTPSLSFKEPTTPISPLGRSNSMRLSSSSSFKEPNTPTLRRANSKGLNVSFAFTL